MRTRVYASSGLALVAVVVLIFALGVDRGSGQGTRAARTADGKPNLSGIWQVMNTANWDLLAHARSAGGRAAWRRTATTRYPPRR